MKKSAINLDATITMPSGSELEEVAIVDDVAPVTASADAVFVRSAGRSFTVVLRI